MSRGRCIVCSGPRDVGSHGLGVCVPDETPEDPYVGLAREYNAVCDKLSAATARASELETEVARLTAETWSLGTRGDEAEESLAQQSTELAALKLEVEAVLAKADELAAWCSWADHDIRGQQLQQDYQDMRAKLNLVTTPTPDGDGKGE